MNKVIYINVNYFIAARFFIEYNRLMTNKVDLFNNNGAFNKSNTV
jgi:hypothetical protein